MPSPQTAPELSAIIVSWNTRSYLEACLGSVFADLSGCPDLCAEVLVVDNASGDASAAMVKDRFPQVCLIEPGENLGFGRANNLALERARGEWVLFLNPDTEIRESGVLAQMVRRMRSDPQIGCLGCRLQNPDGTTQRSQWGRYPGIVFLSLYAFYLERFVHPPDAALRAARRAPGGMLTAAHLLGAALLCRTDLVCSLGGFDPNYFMYLEETDLCHAIARSGHRVVYDPAVSIVHHGQQSSVQIGEKTGIYLVDSYLYFIRKNISRHPVYLQAVRLLLCAASLSRMTVTGARLPVTRDKAKKWRAVRGFWRAARHCLIARQERVAP